MVILYSTFVTPRLQYIVDFFADRLFETPIEITTDSEKFVQADKVRINYSAKALAGSEVHIVPHTLMQESIVSERQVNVSNIDGVIILFPTAGEIGFDIFSASFYLLSRYEEYLPFKPNALGLFPFESSIAYQNHFIKLPLVNVWFDLFIRHVEEKFPFKAIRKRAAFKNIITFDIDIAFAYRHKPIHILAGGLARSLLTGRLAEAGDRILTASGLKADPYNIFSWLKNLYGTINVKPYVFFLLARQYSGVDRNNLRNSKAVRQLIAEARSWSIPGAHPSWKSGDSDEVLRDEKRWLESLLNQPVEKSRQHYLRVSFPETYRALLKVGIMEDYSMGYGGINGYRASTSSPFKWYDLGREEATSLVVYPLPFMDSTSVFQMKCGADEAYEELTMLQERSKIQNDSFISCWHNSVLSFDSEGLQWRNMHEKFVRNSF